MRVMVRARMCTEKGNELARSGKLGTTINSIVENMQPEAAYFTDDNGRRTAFLFMNISDSSEIPKIAEPWFLALNAEVEVHPVMDTRDLGKAETHIGLAVQQY